MSENEMINRRGPDAGGIGELSPGPADGRGAHHLIAGALVDPSQGTEHPRLPRPGQRLEDRNSAAVGNHVLHGGHLLLSQPLNAVRTYTVRKH